MAQSILDSIKKLLGIEAEYTQFDTDIIMHINSTFAKLDQIGITPTGTVYQINGKEETWEEFIGSEIAINMVRSYMYTAVRLLFDPPATSFGIQAMKEQCSDYEWRLRELQNLFVPQT